MSCNHLTFCSKRTLALLRTLSGVFLLCSPYSISWRGRKFSYSLSYLQACFLLLWISSPLMIQANSLPSCSHPPTAWGSPFYHPHAHPHGFLKDFCTWVVAILSILLLLCSLSSMSISVLFKWLGFSVSCLLFLPYLDLQSRSVYQPISSSYTDLGIAISNNYNVLPAWGSIHALFSEDLLSFHITFCHIKSFIPHQYL